MYMYLNIVLPTNALQNANASRYVRRDKLTEQRNRIFSATR